MVLMTEYAWFGGVVHRILRDSSSNLLCNEIKWIELLRNHKSICRENGIQGSRCTFWSVLIYFESASSKYLFEKCIKRFWLILTT